jgi:predicted transposase YbfD/YdcC
MADTAAGISLLDHFSALKDPRQAWKVVYPLPEILLLVLAATLAGADDLVEVRLWGRQHLAFLRRFLPFHRGIPSHTLGDVLNALDPELFKRCFVAWVEDLREREPDVVAIDGKTSRRCHARSKGRDPLHLVSAWASRQRLVLGQEAVAGKSNEITAIPLLLERLELAGALVTIDAIGCQTRIAQAILAKQADYLLAVKTNWPGLHTEIVRYFEDAPASACDRCATTDGDHGRIEVRRHAVSRDVAWLAGNRRHPGEPRFPGLVTVARVETEVERNGQTSIARRYYLSSSALDATAFAHAVRAHWGIENQMHWVLDVVFRDDLARLRTGHGPENMATVRHMAINLVRQAEPTISLKNRRKKAAWSTDYLETLLRQTA